MLNRKKLLKYALLGALVIALGGYGIYRFTYVEPPTYMTAMPSTRDIKQQVYATGTVAGKVEVDVGAQVSGQIQKLYVERGDRVKRGDLLCEIDTALSAVICSAKSIQKFNRTTCAGRRLRKS